MELEKENQELKNSSTRSKSQESFQITDSSLGNANSTGEFAQNRGLIQ